MKSEEDYHLRHAVRIMIHKVEESLLQMEVLKQHLISFGKQMDKNDKHYIE